MNEPTAVSSFPYDFRGNPGESKGLDARFAGMT